MGQGSNDDGMGIIKHRKSGHTTKSPKFRHAMKIEAEKDVRLDKTRIKSPYQSVGELFKKKGK